MSPTPISPAPISRASVTPTPPIELAVPDGGEATSRFAGAVVVPGAVVDELRRIAPCSDAAGDTAEASRDWWPLALHWSLHGQVPARAALVCRPVSVEQVAGIAHLNTILF